MQNPEDQTISHFMQKHKTEIPDEGFSRKVMQKLPERKNYNWIIVLSSALGTLISILFVFNGSTDQIVVQIPRYAILYFLGLIFCIPLASLFLFLRKDSNITIF